MLGPSYELAQAVAELLGRGERAALATVVRAGGSTPQQVGARLLRYADGRTLGTVGGGRLELMVVEALAQCLKDGIARTVGWDLSKQLGMCCGGRMEVFIEFLEGLPRLILFGAGHVACASAALCQRVGFRVTVVDERPELLTQERFPGCTLLSAEPDEALSQLRTTAADWMLVMTHDHQLDERALYAVVSGPHRYVGMIGSRRKVLRILERLRLRHGTFEVSRLYAPVGLSLGATGPDEIAVSIVAELIALRRGQPAMHLRALGEAEREDRVRVAP